MNLDYGFAAAAKKAAYDQGCVGQQAVPYPTTSSPVAPDRKPNALGMLSSQIDQNNDALADIAHRLESLLERLSGPRPQSPEVADAPVQQGGAINAVENLLRFQVSQIARLRAVVDVVENLA